MQQVLEQLGRVRAVVWTGVLFGLGHALSGAWFGRPIDDTLVQVVETMAFGACFAAMRFEIRTLWPLVLLHALDDLLQLRTAGALAFSAQVAITIFLAVYAWWLVWRRNGAVTRSSGIASLGCAACIRRDGDTPSALPNLLKT